MGLLTAYAFTSEARLRSRRRSRQAQQAESRGRTQRAAARKPKARTKSARQTRRRRRAAAVDESAKGRCSTGGRAKGNEFAEADARGADVERRAANRRPIGGRGGSARRGGAGARPKTPEPTLCGPRTRSRPAQEGGACRRERAEGRRAQAITSRDQARRARSSRKRSPCLASTRRRACNSRCRARRSHPHRGSRTPCGMP